MKKHFIILAASVAPIMAHAASGNTINFQGEVTDQTCQVTINGNAANSTVLLPTVSSTVLTTAGATAGTTSFTVGVNGCVAPTTSAQAIKTVFVGNQVTAAGNLGNTGTATNVALQLLDPTTPSAPFNLNNPGGYAAAGLSLPIGATSATHDFAVRYISEPGGATSGSVLGSVQYAVSYL
ncbi:major type 1 subunit fimbrin (pilin) [Cupriavidus metallidurans]|jgi:major type 1 subunit fimbrin (pilin)|uniref:fimbrial protein n=1 Tax=Cupriavidus metallidurans TaxID=119219 RepID=UPI002381A095|nr:fimbrial protein [Cupriavidus metallidurans]MDE4917888.1 fimbrial protein [Cupriavidus metallidurans]